MLIIITVHGIEIFTNLETPRNIFNFSIIYFDQKMNLFGLYHTNTFEQFPLPRLENFEISIRHYSITFNLVRLEK